MGSASECSRSVLEGSYGSLKRVLAGETLQSTQSPAPSARSESASSGTSSADKQVKLVDLSDLPLAAKKRRALAACKKPSTRKFAGMGSESKCTESVMAGSYDRLIEALEYGK